MEQGAGQPPKLRLPAESRGGADESIAARMAPLRGPRRCSLGSRLIWDGFSGSLHVTFINVTAWWGNAVRRGRCPPRGWLGPHSHREGVPVTHGDTACSSCPYWEPAFQPHFPVASLPHPQGVLAPRLCQVVTVLILRGSTSPNEHKEVPLALSAGRRCQDWFWDWLEVTWSGLPCW